MFAINVFYLLYIYIPRIVENFTNVIMKIAYGKTGNVAFLRKGKFISRRQCSTVTSYLLVDIL